MSTNYDDIYSNLIIDKSIGEWSNDRLYSELEDMFYQIYIHWYYNDPIIENPYDNPMKSQSWFISYLNKAKHKNDGSYDAYYNKANSILRKNKLEKIKNAE